MILFRGGAIPACIAGCIPAYLVAGLGGVLSKYALQVSRPTAKGEVEGDLVQATAKGEVEGDLVQAHTQGGVEGDLARGGLLWGVSTPGGVWRPPMTATAAGGTHYTGMHSCFWERF